MKTLRGCYETNLDHIVQFVNSFPNDKLQGPLLMDPSAYFRQPTKLLVIGQETAGWGDDYDDIDAQLEIYRKFKMGEKQPGPFWNITRKIESILGVEKCSCAWSNLNRFDHNGKPPTGAVLDSIPRLDFLVREEIRILRPDVCLFYTNRKYDYRIELLYPNVQFSDIDGLPRSHFARLVHVDLPPLTIRTPHPKTIRMKGWEETFLEKFAEFSGNDRNG